MTRAAAPALALSLAACIPGHGPMMLPGHDCMQCHSSGSGHGGEGQPWTVAGTIAGREGADVVITDQSGWSFTLRSNQAGNFYTAEHVMFPIRVTVEGTPMVDAMADGSCNRCHTGGVGSPSDPTGGP